MSESSTLYSDKSEIKNARTADGFWHSMHLYISDMSASSSQRQKLSDLVDRTKSEWESITSETDKTQALADGGPTPTKPCEAKDWESFDPSNRKDLLTAFSKDLQSNTLFTTPSLSTPFPRALQLSRDYFFSASLGHKLPFKKPISACFGVSSHAQVCLIRSPGRRVRSVQVGYCSQFDSQVFFGADGQIYLVEAEQVERPGILEEGIQIFESDEVMDSDWTLF